MVWRHWAVASSIAFGLLSAVVFATKDPAVPQCSQSLAHSSAETPCQKQLFEPSSDTDSPSSPLFSLPSGTSNGTESGEDGESSSLASLPDPVQLMLNLMLFAPKACSDGYFMQNFEGIIQDATKSTQGRAIRKAFRTGCSPTDILYLVRRILQILPRYEDGCMKAIRFLTEDCRMDCVTSLAVGMIAAQWAQFMTLPMTADKFNAAQSQIPSLCRVLDLLAPRPHPYRLADDLPDEILRTLDEFGHAEPIPNRISELLASPIGTVFPALAAASTILTERHFPMLVHDPDLVLRLYGHGLHIDVTALPWASMTVSDLRSVAPFLDCSSVELHQVLSLLFDTKKYDLVNVLFEVRTIWLRLREWHPRAVFALCYSLLGSTNAIRRLFMHDCVLDAVRHETYPDHGWTLLHMAVIGGYRDVVRALLRMPHVNLRDRRDRYGRTATEYCSDAMKKLFCECGLEFSDFEFGGRGD